MESSTRNPPPLRSLASLFVLLFAVSSSVQAQCQRTFTTQLQASQLGLKYTLWIHAHHKGPLPLVKVLVPMLDIYSPAGVLVYHGGQTQTGQAARVLDALPKLPSQPPAPGVEMPLTDILELTPELARCKNTIVSSHRFVVVSISVRSSGLSKDSPYYIQNRAVDSIPRRAGIDIDVVHVDLVFPTS